MCNINQECNRCFGDDDMKLLTLNHSEYHSGPQKGQYCHTKGTQIDGFVFDERNNFYRFSVCPKFCKVCSDRSTCTECFEKDPKGWRVYPVTIDGKLVCGHCLQKERTYQDKNGGCFGCPDHCAKCRSAEICDQCVKGYYEEKGTENVCTKCMFP